MSKADFEHGEYDTSNTREMFCPYCGEEQEDAWEFSKDSSETECGHCERSFRYQRETEIYYTTEKTEESK